MSDYKLLLVRCFNYSVGLRNISYTDPINFYKILKRTYPSLGDYLNIETFQNLDTWDNKASVNWNVVSPNISGEFLKKNISTPTKVIHESATPELVIEELRKESYTHLGISVNTNSYNDFIKLTLEVKKEFPNIITIAGNSGASRKGTEKYVDHVCLGRGVPFLRKLFKEDIDKTYNPVFVGGKLYLTWGKTIERDILYLVSKIGCHNRCNFCLTQIFFKGEFSGEISTPEQVRQGLLDYRKKLGNRNFTTYIAEPTAIFTHKWWYELFDLMRNDKGDFPLYLLTTARSLDNLDFNRLINSAVRFDSIYLGIESFSRSYGKTKRVDIKKLVERLTKCGIAAIISFIVGFPKQSEEEIWEEIDKLIALNGAQYDVHNLRLVPNTPLWRELKSEGKVLDVPEEIAWIKGFQAFNHKYFRPGFVDIYPLMYKILCYIEQHTGPFSSNYYVVWKNLLKIHRKNRGVIKANMNFARRMSIMALEPWKVFFKPNEEQIKNFLRKIDISSEKVRKSSLNPQKSRLGII